MAGEGVFFVRRQSPAWRDLALDWRRGVPVDPLRFTPDHRIVGFPPNIAQLIESWNARFRIDFFTFRWILAELSRRSIEAVVTARRFNYEQVALVARAAVAGEAFYVYFHDDDDFFAPHAAMVTRELKGDPDAIVTPLFRVMPDLFTFVRDGAEVEFVWGYRRKFDFRFQSNNCAIHSRHCGTVEALRAIKDHVAASALGNAADYSEEILPTVISATVKTPGSASCLPLLLSSESELKGCFVDFATRFAAPELPEKYGWLSRPLRQIASLVAHVYRGDEYESVAHMVG